MTTVPENGSFFSANATISNVPLYTSLNTSITLGGGSLENPYIGCLDRVIVNQAQISLLLPTERQVDILTCGPRPPSQMTREFGNGAWFFGADSYLRLMLQPLQTMPITINFSFRTFSESGILLFLPSTDLTNFVNVFLSEGHVGINFSGFDEGISNSFYNTGLWYEVQLEISENNVMLLLNGSEILSQNNSVNFTGSGALLLGGLSLEEEHLMTGSIDSSSLAGCIRELTINNNSGVDLENSTSTRVSFMGCPGEVERGVRFKGRGRAQFAFPDEQLLHNVSLGFRTTQLTSLLVHFSGLSIIVFHAKIRVEFAGTVLLSSQSITSNNLRHTLLLKFASSGNSSMYVIANFAS